MVSGATPHHGAENRGHNPPSPLTHKSRMAVMEGPTRAAAALLTASQLGVVCNWISPLTHLVSGVVQVHAAETHEQTPRCQRR